MRVGSPGSWTEGMGLQKNRQGVMTHPRAGMCIALPCASKWGAASTHHRTRASLRSHETARNRLGGPAHTEAKTSHGHLERGGREGRETGREQEGKSKRGRSMRIVSAQRTGKGGLNCHGLGWLQSEECWEGARGTEGCWESWPASALVC